MSLFPEQSPEQLFEILLVGAKRIKSRQGDVIDIGEWLAHYLRARKGAVIDWLKAEELDRLTDRAHDAQIEHESEFSLSGDD